MKVKFNKEKWEKIGKKAGWMKTAAPIGDIDSSFLDESADQPSQNQEMVNISAYKQDCAKMKAFYEKLIQILGSQGGGSKIAANKDKIASTLKAFVVAGSDYIGKKWPDAQLSTSGMDLWINNRFVKWPEHIIGLLGMATDPSYHNSIAQALRSEAEYLNH